MILRGKTMSRPSGPKNFTRTYVQGDNTKQDYLASSLGKESWTSQIFNLYITLMLSKALWHPLNLTAHQGPPPKPDMEKRQEFMIQK